MRGRKARKRGRGNEEGPPVLFVVDYEGTHVLLLVLLTRGYTHTAAGVVDNVAWETAGEYASSHAKTGNAATAQAETTSDCSLKTPSGVTRAYVGSSGEEQRREAGLSLPSMRHCNTLEQTGDSNCGCKHRNGGEYTRPDRLNSSVPGHLNHQR